MVERILNSLKEPKKFFIILTGLSATTILLLWKGRWMLFLLWKVGLNPLYLYQTELLLITLTLITWTAALTISKQKKKSYSQLMQMRQDWRLSKNLLEDSEQRDALRSSSEHTKMLMNFLWHMGAVSLLALLVKLSLSPLKML